MLKAPQATKRPFESKLHGDRRVDDYAWLREKENPEVIAHLEAENAHCEAFLEDVKTLQDEIFTEMVARIKEDDATVPERQGEWLYYVRMETGQQYGIHCRKRGADGVEEIILDCNVEAAGQKYFALGIFETSADHRWLAYAVDIDGSEHHTIRFKNLDTGELAPESIRDASQSLAWAGDDCTVFYALLDEHDRPDRVMRHKLGHSPNDDVLVYKELDSQLFVSCGKFRSNRWLFIATEGKVTSEWRVLDAFDPLGEFSMVEPRKRGILYAMEHWGDRFYILVNDTGANFRLIETSTSALGRANWRELIAASADVYLEDVKAFAGHLAIEERENGLAQISVAKLPSLQRRRIDFPEPAYEVSVLGNPEFNTELLRFSYSSMVTPNTVFDFDMNTCGREVKKRQQIPSGYDQSKYACERAFATSADGTQVPVSIVRRKDTAPGAPLYLYGYGSYGLSTRAAFSTARLSLLDRGFTFAIAHVRGGAEMGRAWYDDGKFLKKQNTFNDFVACAERLIELDLARVGEIAIVGGSAGGMLVGAAMNMRPELFKAVVAHVPFVDVLNTMLDDSLPLTTTEYEEWGNPQNPEFYRAIKAYSPYDNVRAQKYPALLAVAGFNDPRVTYWEPAKWIARVREVRLNNEPTLLFTHMGAGHGGASGRYEVLKDVAREYAFILKVFGRALAPALPSA